MEEAVIEMKYDTKKAPLGKSCACNVISVDKVMKWLTAPMS